jgi:hypothetical protein
MYAVGLDQPYDMEHHKILRGHSSWTSPFCSIMC